MASQPEPKTEPAHWEKPIREWVTQRDAAIARKAQAITAADQRIGYCDGRIDGIMDANGLSKEQVAAALSGGGPD